jgi:hypothetical protein
MNAEQTLDQNSQAASELIELRGTRPLFAEELRTRITAGARCVRFEFCFSLLFVTIRRQSPAFLTSSWEQRYLWGLWYSVLALVLGPWGIPWGLLWTPWAIWVNVTGGADCTEEVLAWMDSSAQVAQSSTHHKEERPQGCP